MQEYVFFKNRKVIKKRNKLLAEEVCIKKELNKQVIY